MISENSPLMELDRNGANVPAVELESTADIVRKFYNGINRRDLGSVEDLISHSFIYENLVLSQPFVGRKVKKYQSFNFNSQNRRY